MAHPSSSASELKSCLVVTGDNLPGHTSTSDDSTQLAETAECQPEPHERSILLILLVEPHPLLQPILLAKLTDIQNTTTYVTSSFVNYKAVLSPDICILDRGSLGNRFDSQITQILMRCPLSRLAVLDEELTDPEQSVLIKAGIHGYLSYSHVDKGLEDLVSALTNNHLWFPSTALEYHVRSRLATSRNHRQHPLTDRQKQIASLIRRGYSNKEISSELKISEGTVKFHLAKVFEKLGVRTRRSLLALEEVA